MVHHRTRGSKTAVALDAGRAAAFAGSMPAASIAAAGMSVLVGALLATSHAPTIAVVVASACVLGLMVAYNVGVFAGLMVAVVMNGLPFIDLESYSKEGSFRIADLAVAALVVVLAVRTVSRKDKIATPWWRAFLGWWSFALAGWWAFTVVRSGFHDIPVLKAALYGRDFLYFALLLPLFVGGLRTTREVRGVLITLLAAVLLFVLGHIALVTFGAANGGWFVHETLSNEFEGVTRIYALISDASVATVPIGIGLLLMGSSRRQRTQGGVILAVTALSVLLQFGRATYFGLFVGIVFASGFWLARRRGTVAARRLALALAGLAVAAGFAASSSYRAAPSYANSNAVVTSAPSTGVVAARVASGLHELSSKSGTVQYRYDLTHRMVRVLNGHWADGLGFWHPAVKYVPTLPDGSIRNADVGVLNSIMTMGLIGTVLIYAPLVVVLAACLRRRAGADGSLDWWFFGITAWIVSVIVTSVSLVTLFTISGLVFTAAMLGCTVLLLAKPGRGEAP
jgi:hypothetical protein